MTDLKITPQTTISELSKTSADGHSSTIEIAGELWSVKAYSAVYKEQAERTVSSGLARIVKNSSDGAALIIEADGADGWIRFYRNYSDIEAAAIAAENHVWEVRENAGYNWYLTNHKPGYEEWVVSLSKGQAAIVTRSSVGGAYERYSVKRVYSVTVGELYEISTSQLNMFHHEIQTIQTFEEAAAFAYSLPMYVAGLMQLPPIDKLKGSNGVAA
jgi:hypothetical protein